VAPHENLSPGANRAAGNTNTRADSFVQSHHPIQQEWARRNVPGYDGAKAPGVLLASASGSPHAQASASQRARRRCEGYGTDINHEFQTSYSELIAAGVPKKTAQKAMKDNYKYFDSLGAFK